MVTTLFKRCLGFNDARAFATQKMVTNPRSPEVGNVEFIDCLNLTTTTDGAVEKVAPFATALTHSAPITNISAGKRFIYQDGVDTKEWDGVNIATVGAILDGPIAHTPIDCRISTAGSVYKSIASGTAVQQAVLGTNPNPTTSKVFAAQPAFDHAFVYNAKLYAINHSDPRFLQYSEDYHYDLWDLGDGFIGHTLPILQAGAIPGVMLTAHDGGVTVYTGTDPATGFVKRFYPVDFLDGTLYSGFVSKAYGYGHIFLGHDGVYLVGIDGELKNLTTAVTDHIGWLNSSYTCATMHAGKYLAFGNNVCIEYDFETKSVLKRSTSGVKAATIWNKQPYFAIGSTIATLGTEIDTGNIAASATLPFSDWGYAGVKFIECFYFTGEISGDVLITATDNTGKFWEVEVSEVGKVSKYRIKTPGGAMGTHISIKIDCTSGAFRMEELTAVVTNSKRSR